MTTRNPIPPLKMPPYELEDVKNCVPDLSGSVIVDIEDRIVWLQSLAEMLLLCNESANRRMTKVGNQQKSCSDGTQTKPLGLEYMADRIDIDDPLRGYQVHSEETELILIRFHVIIIAQILFKVL